ncbi:hypothetical protein ACFFGT_29840 [Mucilaginibacter angelicae]|uniref:Uncharacterized protein n=1 Tax=Mucilaginibacter angelicae TaxID=869718 RepID=A0ABV6LG66_9SPHI
MEIRLNIDDDFMKSLSEKLGESKASKITTEALTILNWAAEEAKNGRIILSTNKNGEDVKQLAMPALDKIIK